MALVGLGRLEAISMTSLVPFVAKATSDAFETLFCNCDLTISANSTPSFYSAVGEAMPTGKVLIDPSISSSTVTFIMRTAIAVAVNRVSSGTFADCYFH